MSVENLITEHLDIWTSAIKTKSAAGRGISKKLELVGVKKLRELILELAVRGKLVPQDPNDEPASELLKKIGVGKARLVEEGKIKKQKPLPPIAENEKPFELPNGWAFERLGNFSTVFSGCSFKSGDFNSVSGIRVIKITNAGVGKLIDTDEFLPESFLEKHQSFQVFKNDMILALTRPYISEGLKVSLCPDNYHKSLLNQRVAAIRAFQHPEYLFLNLRSPYILNLYKNRFGGNGLQPNLKMSDVTELVIALPPLYEQHRIVAKVDELMALCDQLEAQTESSIDAHKTLVEVLLATLTDAKNADELNDNWQTISQHFDVLFTTQASIDQLKQTILQLAVMGKLVKQDPKDESACKLLERIATEKQQLIKDGKIKKQKPLPPITAEEKPFGIPNDWEWCHGETIADFVDPQPSHRTPPKVEGGVPYIGYTDINHVTGIDFEGSRKVGKNIFEEHLKRYTLKTGDFVFGKIGTLGQPYFLEEPFNYCLSANLILIQPILNAVVPRFLALYLNSPALYKVLGDKKTNSTHGVFGIKKARLLLIPFPPMQEQKRIVSKVDNLMTLCDSLKERLNQTQTTQLHLTDSIVEQAL
jgi:type I restriction enzyme S subunit